MKFLKLLKKMWAATWHHDRLPLVRFDQSDHGAMSFARFTTDRRSDRIGLIMSR